MTSTNVSANEIYQESVLIEKGARAPYDGILMPQESFDYLQARDYENDMLTKQLMEPKETVGSDYTSHYIMVVLGALVMGYAASEIVHNR